MLALAQRELAFLRDQIAAMDEITETPTGKELLDLLTLGHVTAMRLLLERDALSGATDPPQHAPLHRAIAALRKDGS